MSARTRKEIDLAHRPIVFELLLILSDGEKHGYGLMQELEDRTDGRWSLGPGTLYRNLREMEQAGWIENAGRRAVSASDSRERVYYRITRAGRAAMVQEAERMAALVREVRRVGGR